MGGAGIAGYRLHQALLKEGIDSNLLVGRVTQDNPRVKSADRCPRINKIIAYLSKPSGLNYATHVGTHRILQHPFYREADILNFHNLHAGYFNYLSIPALAQSKPTAYTLHDMWSFTGHCAYSYDCDRWQTGCGRCPYPETYPAIARDSTKLEWKLKQWAYRHCQMTIVSPSRWLADLAQQSLLSRFPVCHIPYGIDTQLYRPLDRSQCRSLLGLETPKYILLSASASLNDPRKGLDLLLAALAKLPQALKLETLLLLMGREEKYYLSPEIGMTGVSLGYIGGDRLKAIAYNAADLFVLSTRADNLPLVLQESMSCGTPMVSFRVGGVPELVRPGITGELADPEDPVSLAGAIERLLVDATLREAMSRRCREIAIAEYPLQLQAERYVDLYRRMLASSPPTAAATAP